jgi:xanthine/uracil/vitamin C permease (AzgA family)
VGICCPLRANALFLALIGLQNAGLVAADATTLVKLGDLTQAKALLAIAGFLAIAGLAARKVPGAIIFGVIAVTLAAVWLGLEPWHGLAAMPPSLAPTFLRWISRAPFGSGFSPWCSRFCWSCFSTRQER